MNNEFVHIDEFIKRFWTNNIVKQKIVSNKDIDIEVHKLIH